MPMTDKPIIDGVDVAGCRYFTSEWDFNNCGHVCKGTECRYKRLWYKKQLDKLKVENEQLKEQLDSIREAIGEKYGMADIIKIRTILDDVLNDRD